MHRFFGHVSQKNLTHQNKAEKAAAFNSLVCRENAVSLANQPSDLIHDLFMN